MNFLKNKINLLKNKFKLNFRHSSFNKKIPTHTFLVLPLIYMPNVAYLADDEKKENEHELEMKDIVRGEYENKIRTFSTIEKRFLIFAKIKKYGDFRMDYYQFLDSLVPFQYIKTLPQEDLITKLKENKNFQEVIKKIDINGDGYINFEEYIVLSVFMSVPISDFLQQFPSGKLTREQLAEFLMKKIETIDSLKITNKSMIDGRIIKTDYNKLYTFIVDFISIAFKNVNVDIKKDIFKFSYDFYLLMLYYEFYRIPQSSENKIPLKEFAKVLMSYVNIYKSKSVKKKIDHNEINLSGEISFDEFVSFFWFLRCMCNEKLDTFSKGELSFDDLKILAKNKLKEMPSSSSIKKEISNKQIKLFIDLFDRDGNIFLKLGNEKLAYEEINDIIKRRAFYSNSKGDFIKESEDISSFITKGYNFIKENLWFLR
jgi:hypothetical protein